MKYKSVEEINENKHRNSRLVCIDIFYVKYLSCSIRFCKCICECGKETKVRLQYLINGKTISCGCKKRQDTIDRNKKWENNSRLIGSKYRAMMKRCYDVNYNYYCNYGGKGVRVCEDWINNYQSFVNWCNENGIEKGVDLDKDFKGDGFLYSPETCCLIPMSMNRAYQPKHNGSINSDKYKQVINEYLNSINK